MLVAKLGPTAILAAVFLAQQPPARAGGVSGPPSLLLASPQDGALIPSAFVAITGAAAAGTCLRVSLDAAAPRQACADASGKFDLVARAAKGAHALRAAADSGAAVEVRFSTDPPSSPPQAAAGWDLLREGDIILSRTQDSPQIALYNPQFTHAALYLGPGRSGQALVAEAVSEEASEGLGEVRSVAIEHSLAWRTAQRVEFLRLRNGLDPAQRQAILRYARGEVNRGLKFWSAADDFGAVYKVWLKWDQKNDRPLDASRFDKALDGLRARMISDQRFNCTTFVWRTYWEGSKGRINLTEPNHMGLGGQLTHAFSPAFLQRVLPDFITPDSLYFSDKLSRVQRSR